MTNDLKLLHLVFKNGRIFPESLHKNKNIAYNWETKKWEQIETVVKNFQNPVTVNIVANVLRALSGEIPIPTLKPHERFPQTPIYEELAKNSFVRYATPVKESVKTKFGIFPAFTETERTSKAHVKDSHMKNIKTKLEKFDGTISEYAGRYNWDYFYRTFENHKGINVANEIINLFNGFLETDMTKKSFYNAFKAYTCLWGNEEFENQAENIITNYGINAPWAYVLFGFWIKNKERTYLPPTSNNTSYKSQTPLLLLNGVANVMSISGEIYCPITDEIYERLKKYGGFATIFDGGVVFINNIIENNKPSENYLHKCGFDKVLTLDEAITLYESTLSE